MTILGPMELREFQEEDAAHIVRWAIDVAEVRRWAGLSSLPSVPDVLGWHADPDVHAYVLGRVHRPVAYGEVWVDQAEGEVELARIIVDPAKRRAGFGARLVDALLGRAAGFGLPVAYVRVVPENVAAIRCYEGCGFCRVAGSDEDRFNEGQPVRYVWLRRQLPSQ